jgi:hypothetical protein
MVVKCVILAMALAAGAPHYAEDDPTKAALKDFNERVEKYWDIHKKAEEAAPPVNKKKDDPTTIVQHESGLAKGIRAARMDAVEGDIFTRPVQTIFVAAIRKALSTAKGPDAREMMLGEGNPRHPESPAKIDLKVNAKYPSSAPLAAMAPSVLMALPKLPQGLEYRFVGRHLILFDSKANLIVDILRNAVR